MKKYFIKTFGCQMNISDSERIISFLEGKGLVETANPEKADLAIFNTCGVRKTAEDRAFGQIHNLWKKRTGAIIILTGCLAHRKDVQQRLGDKVQHFIPIKDISLLGSIVGFAKESAIESTEDNDYLKLTPKYKSTETVFVPIMTGCNNFCSYCVVPYARGPEWSRSLDEIFKEITLLNQKDCKKVILLGQNVNSYSFLLKKEIEALSLANSSSITFPFLLKILAENFPKITFEFLTSHPKDFSPKLIQVIAKNKNISKRIHLPIQSGSDSILNAMNRSYTQKHYLQIIEQIKKQIPLARISTDVIVGFPGETEADFQATVAVFKEVNFFEAYINKYSSRPGTTAEKLRETVTWTEKKRREECLRKLL